MGARGNFEKLSRAFSKAEKNIAVEAKRSFEAAGRDFVRAMKTLRFRPYTSNRNSGSILQSRTGYLSKSINSAVTGSTIQDISLRVYSSGIKYANLQEYGESNLRPKRSKYLAIPLDAALGRRGILKKTVSYGGEMSGGPRAYPGGFFLKKPNGKLFYVMPTKSGKKKKLLYLFILKTSVSIPPRLNFRKTWEALGPRRAFNLKQGITRGFNRAFEGVI